ncbi:MAG TPA: hypothetical protein VN043_11340 [Rhodanobacter sp.]|jgi:hypothetical protein|nr:hypothetical protein [Rhodanobacter sp.]
MTNSPTRPLPSRALHGALVLTLFTSLFAGTTHAQVFVTDKLAIAGNQEGFKSQLAQTVSQYVRQGLQYEKQIQQYMTQVQQYQQILTSIQGLATGGIKLTGGQLQQITDASNLIQQSCPGAGGGGILGDMTSIVTSSFSQSITTTQQNICAQIVLAQVHKYNATVKVVNDTQQFGQELQQITSKLGSMTSQGDSDRIAANASAHNDQIASEMVDWQSQMAKDDAIIATLQQQQGILARVALNGSNTILGNAVQATAFAAAFH